MPSISINNVTINGISTCVPSSIELVSSCECLSLEEAALISKTTGIYERRIAGPSICSSDMCFKAANVILNDLQWDRSEVDVLIFVSQTPDYVIPSTAPILQDRLGLSTNCMSFDISLGCSGYVYGLITIASLISSGKMRKGLLLVGDTVSKLCSTMDKSTYPLFGDAGSATALSYDINASPITSCSFTDGKGMESIIIKDGGSRYPFSEDSLRPTQVSSGIMRSGNNLVLDGMNVFSFGITKVPEVVNKLMQGNALSEEDIDYFIFHQANKFMNDKIAKKLKLTPQKVPQSLEKFGNTSCVSIPLTITTSIGKQISKGNHSFILCGFGVGLSWSAVYINSGPIYCSPLIEI